VRAVFLVLLSANLLFLAWARWIDSPRDAGAQDSLSRLPRLQLVTESHSGTRPTSAILDFATPSRTGLVVRSLASLATESPAISALATAEKMSFRPVEPSQTCTSVGPFNDIASAARAAGLLTQRGYHLQQRAEEGETIEGYWVFVGGLQSDEDVAQVVGRLGKSGFTDAHIMKNFSTNRRVSVGMFSTRDGAEKRATAIRNMGLQPEIGERRFPGTIYWVDVTLKGGPGVKQLLPDYLFADIGHAKVAMRPCPGLLEPLRAPGDDADGVTWRRPRTTVASAPKLP
jgi:cell division septation protein DedD